LPLARHRSAVLACALLGACVLGCESTGTQAGTQDSAPPADAAPRERERDAMTPQLTRIDASAASDASTPSSSDAGSGDASTDAGAPRLRASLVDPHAWRQLTAANDPFDDRPQQVACSAGSGFGFEDFGGEASLFVATLPCDYLAVAQPSLVELRAGDTVTLRLWQSTLTAPQGSELHLALWMGDGVAWEEQVAIPREAGLVRASWTASSDIPAGSRIVFHLHNHGANEYNLLEISREAATVDH
jgi:hypothetical protein